MRNFILLLIIIGLYSCDDRKPLVNTSFDNSFPKRAKNLTYDLGDAFALKRANDTLQFNVYYNRKSKENSIVNKGTKDTIFSGKVNRYRGLYIFNQQINDSAYWIYAVKIEDKTIRGLETEWLQMMHLSDEIEKILKEKPDAKKYLSAMIASVNMDTSNIMLIPDKKILKRFYNSYIDSLDADSIISKDKEFDINTFLSDETAIEEINTENDDNLSLNIKIYPNPVVDFVNIETNTLSKKHYKLIDIKGNIKKEGYFSQQNIKLTLDNFQVGTYFILIENQDGDYAVKKIVLK